MDLINTDLFPAADKQAWLAQVRKELKDESAYEDLRWESDDFAVEPYYTADELAELPIADIQSAQKSAPGWLNAPEYILITDPKATNPVLRNALQRGADALVITLSAGLRSGVVDDLWEAPQLSRLLDGIKLSETPVYFRLSEDPAPFVRALKTVAPYQLKGGLLTAFSDATAEVTRQTLDSPQFRTVCADSHAFHNAGATATQELAFTLASLADAYDQLTDDGLPVEQLISKTLLSVSVGTSYFMELAKLRALRVVFSRFLQAYGQSAPAFIHAQTSAFYNAKATPYTNLLRATTEAMTAVMGGCDVLTVRPYDRVLGRSTEFGERVARNVSVLLNEESYLDKVADPSAGSYYIETLTHQLAEAAWALFGRVEELGGLAKAIKAGFVQTEIERAYQAKVEAVRNGKVLVGVTKFRFDEESIESHHASDALKSPPPSPLPDRRLAEEFE